MKAEMREKVEKAATLIFSELSENNPGAVSRPAPLCIIRDEDRNFSLNMLRQEYQSKWGDDKLSFGWLLDCCRQKLEIDKADFEALMEALCER